MLTTLIYRSQMHLTQETDLILLVEKANAENAARGITGILLLKDNVYLQILEGDECVLEQLFSKIKQDERHSQVVELMRDYAPRRRFENVGMMFFDLNKLQTADVLRKVRQLSQLKGYLSTEERVYKFIHTFISQKSVAAPSPFLRPDKWSLHSHKHTFHVPQESFFAGQCCQFAFQPIIEPLAGNITSLEALIRDKEGGSPANFFASIPQEQRYEVDLKAKSVAFALAKEINIGDHKISINILPMSLVVIPDAIEYLLQEIKKQGLVPEQVIVEVTEDEMISGFSQFSSAIKKLRVSGMGLAIDDFGAGYAGLSLLTKIQPDKVKIDREIITDIHQSGPKQAVVRSIINCCCELEIAVVAEGIERIEEWCWLESAGIKRFQGFLFAMPKVNGVGDIRWPVKKSEV
ncbi:diguanylate phosphodiesterase [Klebsiella grimontii]|uniref:diguanylate phosphodiesterase n=1 Tax=Klebsiella grimontii TaxID=2058152 RepID=UPI001CCA8A3F|nr:diguanylate phosphodiesterase [Klebsiella grimontii]MBZ7358462.1 diguanylate phosphodiesterase [Klebsiella grimontii]